MLGMRSKQHEVVNVVVKLISIDVVDALRPNKRPFKVVLHDGPGYSFSVPVLGSLWQYRSFMGIVTGIRTVMRPLGVESLAGDTVEIAAVVAGGLKAFSPRGVNAEAFKGLADAGAGYFERPSNLSHRQMFNQIQVNKFPFRQVRLFTHFVTSIMLKVLDSIVTAGCHYVNIDVNFNKQRPIRYILSCNQPTI